ncbi:MAG: signal peptidase I [Treponema sp.]|nr:signal peptidase I [Treponema sp.]
MKKLIFFGLLIGLFLKLFVFDFLKISGKSMEPTLSSGNHIVINKAAYGIQNPFTKEYFFTWKSPKKNDVVTFLNDNKIVVKRCVLTEGDSLEILVDSGYHIIINNQKVPLSEFQYLQFAGTKTVPSGYIFVLGDNFLYSVDSRDYGFVSTKSIKGKAIIYE